jgi:hypothetical protein
MPNLFVTFPGSRVTVRPLDIASKPRIINTLHKSPSGFRIAIEKAEVLGMSFRNRVLAFALAAALAVVAGLALSATGIHNAVNTVASAVWGS